MQENVPPTYGPRSRDDTCPVDASIVPRQITDYSRFHSRTSMNRRYAFLPKILKCMEQAASDAVFLASGLPNSSAFPIVDIDLELSDGSQICLGEESTSVALQYGVTDGYAPLLNLLKDFLRRYLGIDEARLRGRKLIVTPSSQDALSKTFEAILNEGDTVIIGEIVDSPLITAALAPLKLKYMVVKCDGSGLMPESLREELAKLENEAKTTPGSEFEKPKILVVGAMTSNPTTVSRMQEIYRTAQELNCIILEYDPYCFLAEERSPSFLAFDVDRRVIRIDSFAQILSPGLGLGYLIGPEPIVERIAIHQQNTWDHPPTFTQVILSRILVEWGWDEFDKHVEEIGAELTRTRRYLEQLCKKHLSDVAEDEETVASGSSVWLKLRENQSTNFSSDETDQVSGIYAVPGKLWSPLPDTPNRWIKIVPNGPTNELEEGMRKLRNMITDITRDSDVGKSGSELAAN